MSTLLRFDWSRIFEKIRDEKSQSYQNKSKILNGKTCVCFSVLTLHYQNVNIALTIFFSFFSSKTEALIHTFSLLNGCFVSLHHFSKCIQDMNA